MLRVRSDKHNKIETRLLSSATKALKQQSTNIRRLEPRHDFFLSWFLNHSPFLVKNVERKKKRKMFIVFHENLTILRLTNVYDHTKGRQRRR